MSRTRIIIKKISISKAGQVHFFEIKLPKNAIRLSGVACDIATEVVAKAVKAIPKAESIAYAYPADSVSIKVSGKTMLAETSPALATADIVTRGEWDIRNNPLAGKLKLQSLEKANIFYAEQVWLTQYADPFGDFAKDFYAVDAFAITQKKEARKVDVPSETMLICGMYKDALGANLKRDITYTVKVFLWVETDEPAIILGEDKS